MSELKNDVLPKVTKKRAAKKKTTKKKVVKKTVVTKKAARRKTAVKVASNARQNQFSHRERYEMIAKMAYFRAEKRGFEPGWEQQDWLESEKLVDGMFNEV